MNKTILGLDLGTNSIGWALIDQDFENKQGKILGMGSRIIPMSQDILKEFGAGGSIKTQTAERTDFRAARRLRERHLLRRERLHRILNILDFLPKHYSDEIDFEKKIGQFKDEKEPKIAYSTVFEKERKKAKYEFLFKDSFEEMLSDFRKYQPQLLRNEIGEEKLIPYDWTIYYLRKKSLTEKIKKEELAWLLLNFNQKRGYYQLRGEDEEENPNKLIELHSLKVTNVTADKPQQGEKEIWYSILLENGWVYRRQSKTPLFDWIDKVKDFVVTTELNEDGSVKKDKDGNEKRTFRAPGADDWTLQKKKTEKEIINSNKTVGTYIYDSLLQNPKQKIRGKLVRTIERKFYKAEAQQILTTQITLQPELFTTDLYIDCIRELYRNNDPHQQLLSTKDFLHLFIDDIIFYQRPLRSQKSLIGNCTLEFRNFKNDSGQIQKQYLKTTPKSNPYYQEFRIWQWIYNLSIYQKADDQNVTLYFLNHAIARENLFEFLNNRKEVEQKHLLKYLLEQKGLKGKALNIELEKYRWNYVEDKIYPCNETRSMLSNRLSKVIGITKDFLSKDTEYNLWHLIYSVTDKLEYEKALQTFAKKNNLEKGSFINIFKKIPPFKTEYGAFSEKAIKKLLPLMRLGKYWDWDNLDPQTKSKVGKIITGEYDQKIKDQVREKTLHLTKEEQFQGLPLWLAQYIVYDRHSESANAVKWNSATDLENFLLNFKQNSLRNPIVEQIITETLRVVKDIWDHYGQGKKDFFCEIHIELGREMKNNSEERKKITNQIIENENTNLRIKALLAEMFRMNDADNIRPYSTTQMEILKIYEEGVLNSGIEIEEDIIKISKMAQPSPPDLKRYKLWLEQKYRSPYTGEIIPLNKLFTKDYEIEHIIPQSRYFDDSLNNKVICEAAVNKEKDNQLGYEFIKKHHGQIIECGLGKKVTILGITAYEELVKEFYSKNRNKRNKLLMEEIPEKMVERQLNDTRYISKFISGLLSNIVRAESNDDSLNSKNLISCNGKITNRLKQDWGLNDVWNNLILPRFDRLNQSTRTTDYTTWNEKYKKSFPTVPLILSKGFSSKRIDHRHHAMDALIIACTTRDHVNLLNNESANSQVRRYDLQHKLRHKESYFNEKEGRQKEAFKDFFKPWETFTEDTHNSLNSIVVSFKQNLRVINKATNTYEKWIVQNGEKVKGKDTQKGTNWAIRKPMHVPQPYSKKIYQFDILKISDNVGKKDLIIDPELRKKITAILEAHHNKIKDTQKFLKEEPLIDTNGNPILLTAFKIKTEKFRKRQLISELSNRGKGGITNYEEAINFINKVSDYKIREDLLSHLSENGLDINKAFSIEGIEIFNSRRKTPILKLPIAESGSGRFALGNSIKTRHKWMEAQKGTNLFFGIYIDKNSKRSFETIALNIVIERQKQGLSPIPEINDSEKKLIMHLSPNDLVYVPNEEELANGGMSNSTNLTQEQINRIYKFVSCTGNEAHFVPNSYAKEIIKNEIGSNNKSQNTIDGKYQIKSIGWKLQIDRLGFIKSIIIR